MTPKEYDRMRMREYGTDYRTDYRQKRPDHHFRKEKNHKSEDGYLAFFKLRCLICFVLFLGLVAVDQRMNAKEYEPVKQVINYFHEETIPVAALIPWKE
ncbi:MAG: hypothetical protein Q4B70_12430 [Lachnospiraceae bacterium]|nr:hypothetical protein [Lachnospiraceae bacterium]